MLPELVEALRLDLGDLSGDSFSDESLERFLLKAVFPVGRDLAIVLRIVDGAIEPEPVGEARELIILMAQVHACQMMRAVTANNFSFSSGDKRVDKSKTPEHWAKLQADLTNQYQQRIAASRAENGQESSEGTMLTPIPLSPVIYEQGSNGYSC